MDGGSSSLPLSPPPPQVYLRRPMPPPSPAPPPKVHFFRTPAPIPIFTGRNHGPRAAPKPPVVPSPPAPVAAQATPLPQPSPPAPTANQQLPPRLPQPPLAAGAMRPPRPPQPPSADGAMLPPPAPQAVAKGQQRAAPRSNDESNGREISQAEVNKEETAQVHDKASTTAPVKVVKRPKNLKASKHTLDTSNGGIIEGDAGPLYSSNHCRYDSSLSLLTKKFISLLQGAEDGTIDLNKAAETLEVQKRRIYDITNVLEGVDLIEKTLKNMIRWKGFDMSKPKEKECQISALKEELETLYKEDDRLENEIRETQDKLDALALNEDKRKLLYILKDDINKIPHFKESTLIAINAPRGTSIEVLDPSADRYLYGKLELTKKHYKMVLRSSMGPIDCYLISDRQEIFNPDHQVAPDNSEHVIATGSSHALEHMDCDPDETLQQMDCDTNEAVQQMDPDQGQALKKGESNAARTYTAGPSRKHESTADILRIVPSDADADADYWFASDPDVSVTDTWGP